MLDTFIRTTACYFYAVIHDDYVDTDAKCQRDDRNHMHRPRRESYRWPSLDSVGFVPVRLDFQQPLAWGQVRVSSTCRKEQTIRGNTRWRIRPRLWLSVSDSNAGSSCNIEFHGSPPILNDDAVAEDDVMIGSSTSWLRMHCFVVVCMLGSTAPTTRGIGNASARSVRRRCTFVCNWLETNQSWRCIDINETLQYDLENYNLRQEIWFARASGERKRQGHGVLVVSRNKRNNQDNGV